MIYEAHPESRRFYASDPVAQGVKDATLSVLRSHEAIINNGADNPAHEILRDSTERLTLSGVAENIHIVRTPEGGLKPITDGPRQSAEFIAGLALRMVRVYFDPNAPPDEQIGMPSAREQIDKYRAVLGGEIPLDALTLPPAPSNQLPVGE
jgi:hypothetical protein